MSSHLYEHAHNKKSQNKSKPPHCKYSRLARQLDDDREAKRSSLSRYDYLQRLKRSWINWKGPMPNVREILRPGEIEWLLVDAIERDQPRSREKLIDFVTRTGYRDAPQRDKKGRRVWRRRTPLHRAAARHDCDLATIGMLFRIYDSCEVNYADDEDTGLTHFHVACQYDCYEVVEKFLDAGQDPDCLRWKSADPPLCLALDNNANEVAELLLERGADPNLADRYGSTPLHIVCKNRFRDGDAELVETLFRIGAATQRPVLVDARDSWGQTPLHSALRRGNKKLAELLLRRGADPNLADAEGATPLHIICDNHDDEWMQKFFEICEESRRTVRIDAPDNSGNTPIHLALRCDNRRTMVERLLLLSRRCRSSIHLSAANDEGTTPLHVICRSPGDDGPRLADLFLSMGGDVGARDRTGRTPLHLAVASLRLDMLDLLLERARPDLRDFVFPSADDFVELKEGGGLGLELKYVKDLLATLDRLGRAGYPAKLSDALQIMELFARYELFELAADLETGWYDDERFVRLTKATRVGGGGGVKASSGTLTLHDLIVNMCEEEVAKLLIDTEPNDDNDDDELFQLRAESAEFLDADRIMPGYLKACHVHLCEIVSRRFFQSWAWRCLVERTKDGFDGMRCEEIIEQLRNKDLWSICLAATGR